MYRAYYFPEGKTTIEQIEDKFLFGKNYMTKPELEEDIPKIFLEKAIFILRTATKNDSVKPLKNQLESFVKRLTLTHIVIWLYYKEVFSSQLIIPSERNYLSHPTRNTLFWKLGKSKNNPAIAWETLLPRLLSPYFEKYCIKREDVKKVIMGLAEELKPQKYKKIFLDGVQEFQNGDFKKLELIKRDLESLFKNEKEKRKWGLLGTYNFVDGTVGAGLDWETEIGFKKNHLTNLERAIINLPERYDSFEKEADRLFPELK